MTGYKHRDAIVAPKHAARLSGMGQALIAVVVVDGWVVGTWKRALRKDAAVVELNMFTRPGADARRAITKVGERYGEFLGLRVVMC